MKKTVLFLALTALCASFVFGGGGRQQGAPSGGAGQAAVQASADNPSWSQNKTPYKATWFVSFDWYSKAFNPQVNLWDKALVDNSGISIEFSVGNYEKLNMLIATNALPDIVTMDAVASQRNLLEDGGVLLDLEDLAAKYAPDLNIPQSMKDWYRAGDGKWYSIANFYYGPERTNPAYGGYYATHQLNYARQDILDQIGMKLSDLETKAGFLNALRAVRDKKIQYNGRTVIPYIGGIPEYLAPQFGATLEDAAGNLVNIRRTPEFLEALLFLNTCYNENLITDEQFTENSTQRDTRVAAGYFFAYTGWTVVENPRKALYSADPNAKIFYAGVMKGDSGSRSILEGVNCGGWTTTSITKNAKNPAKCIQLMAYLSTEKDTLDARYGYNGYDVRNGKAYQKKSIADELAANYDAATARYMSDVGWLQDWNIIQKYTPRDLNDLYYDIDHYDQERDPRYPIYDNKAFVFVNPPDGTDLAVTKVKIDDYWTQAVPRIIMAANANECRRLYNEAIAQAESLGWKELEAYQNAEFKKNKVKLGQTRAWPR
jgi:putative aldouronate transport system substrate-binding protein